MAVLAVHVALALPASWQTLRERKGVRLERRPVSGSVFYEYRASAASAEPPERVIDHLWTDYVAHPPEMVRRRVLRERPGEKLIYDLAKTPIVSDRDYAFRFRRLDDATTRVYQVVFEAVSADPYGQVSIPEPPKGVVRMGVIRGSWTIEPSASGGSEISYVVYNDPGGSVPAWLVHGGQADAAEDLIRFMLSGLRENRSQRR